MSTVLVTAPTGEALEVTPVDPPMWDVYGPGTCMVIVPMDDPLVGRLHATGGRQYRIVIGDVEGGREWHGVIDRYMPRGSRGYALYARHAQSIGEIT